jgi:hypothetical protein
MTSVVLLHWGVAHRLVTSLMNFIAGLSEVHSRWWYSMWQRWSNAFRRPCQRQPSWHTSQKHFTQRSNRELLHCTSACISACNRQFWRHFREGKNNTGSAHHTYHSLLPFWLGSKALRRLPQRLGVKDCSVQERQTAPVTTINVPAAAAASCRPAP